MQRRKEKIEKEKIELTKNEVKIIADIFYSFSGQGGIEEFSEKKCHNLSIKKLFIKF